MISVRGDQRGLSHWTQRGLSDGAQKDLRNTAQRDLAIPIGDGAHKGLKHWVHRGLSAGVDISEMWLLEKGMERRGVGERGVIGRLSLTGSLSWLL